MEANVALEPRTEIAPAVLERARAGDQSAFTELVRHYDRGLRALAFRLLGEASRVDDALQEAYVRAFQALGGFERRSAVSTWLYRIAYNACVDELRRAGRRPEDPLELVARAPDPRPGAEAEVAERDRIERALAALSPEHRAAVVLVDAQGFDYASAAEALGVAEGTIASRLSTARAALRAALDESTEADDA
jgi:RNA polymerase sigma-70 factor (ECF subfamily)